jgi:hypothetical protein
MSMSFQQEAAAAIMEAEEQKKTSALVRGLYVALAAGDGETVGKMVKANLEWRFHGPPSCQHLMRILTGHIESSFTFNPHSITAIGHNLVVAEGRGDESGYWVHVWTLDQVGCMVTQLREYFNTSLVVTEFKSVPPLSSSCSLVVQKKKACSQSPLWQSKVGKSKQKLMPGLVLAI